MIFNDNETIYFNQQTSNATGNYEHICFNIINKNKLYLYDCINDDIKISIKNIIKPDSKIGKYILFYLGYNMDRGHKMIIKCNYSYKTKFAGVQSSIINVPAEELPL